MAPVSLFMGAVERHSPMHPDHEYDPALHKTALVLARTSLDQLDGTTFAAEVLARAYLDLLERRGMPPTLRMEPTIQLQSGAWFDFLDPLSTPVSPEDIAAGLAKQSRYTGHTLGFVPYTIAQHCCIASDIAPPHLKFEALMHDAPEAVLGDIATPLKQLLVDYKVIEDMVSEAFAEWFNVSPKTLPEVKVIDIRMACTEKRDLMADVEQWGMFDGIEPYDFRITPWAPEEAYFAWLERFSRLRLVKWEAYEQA